MKHTYAEINEILKVSQERPLNYETGRTERFSVFKRAVSFHAFRSAIRFPSETTSLIAGTNGKGSVAKTLETLLKDEPHANVGLYTSPHLMEPTERIRSGGTDLSPSEMVQAYERIEDIVLDFELSHFEILTLMMIDVFFAGVIRPKVTHAIIEVGVGGRLDPTRAIPHDTAVITTIGLDHEAILGKTVGAIAREKLAIADGARRLIFIKPPNEAQAAFDEARALYKQTAFIEARTFPSTIELSEAKPLWKIKTPWGDSNLNLLGERAVQNTSLALEVLDQSGFDVAKLLPLLATVDWPGRMERLAYKSRSVFLSGDHNEQGVESLKEILSHFDYENVWLVIGVGSAKPVTQMLSIYREIPRARLVLTMTTFRPLAKAVFDSLRADAYFEDPIQALDQAVEKANARDLIAVSGSLYLVGDLRAHILTINATEQSR